MGRGGAGGWGRGAGCDDFIVIGNSVTPTGNDQLKIEGGGTSTPLSYGEFDNYEVTINGDLGIFQAPSYPLDVYTNATSTYAGRFFNDDFSIMLVYASPIAGLSEEKVKAVTDMIQKDVDTITKPAGVEYKITGMAPLINELLRLMREDMFFTTIVAAIIIFMLLALLERSLTKGFLVFLPLIFAIIWTFGTMGLLGIPISLSTVIVGAVIIGLGVGYGIFMVSRHYEARKRDASDESVESS